MRPLWNEFVGENTHAQYCPVKNTKSALFFVAYFSIAALGRWIGLREIPASPDPVLLLFNMVVVAALAKTIMDFTCLRERFVFGLAIALIVASQIERFTPAVFGQNLLFERHGRLVLAITGLAVSLSMLIQSFRPGVPMGSTSD